MNDQPLVIDDHGLGQGLRALHRERANLPDPPSLHQRLGSMPLERMPTRRRWLPSAPRLNLVPMLNATRFVAAALVVAVFGGALLTTTLSPQTAPQEIPVGATDPIVAPGLDPVSAFVTKELSPGVHQVLADAAGTDLDKVWSVAVSPDGAIWIRKRNYLVQAGDPTRHLEGALGFDDSLLVGAGDQAMVVRMSGDDESIRVRAGDAWIQRDLEGGFPLLLAESGAAWATSRTTRDEVVRFGLDGSTIFSRDDLGIASDDSCWTHERIGADPSRWCGWSYSSMAGGTGETVWLGIAGYGGGLARFDGADWEPMAPTGAQAGFGIGSLAVARDGTIWAAVLERDLDSVPATGRISVAELRKTPYLARFDGVEWTLFDWPSWTEIDCTRVCTGGLRMQAGPKGELWTQAPLASFDGTIWKRYEVPTLPEWKRHGIVHDLDLALDGTVLLATEQDASCQLCDDLPRNERALFILDPDVVQPRRTERAVTR